LTKSETPLHILREAEALIEGHFVLKSGRHSSSYVNKDMIYTDSERIALLCMDLGQPFVDRKRPELQVQAVVGPAIGGVILAHCVAKHLAFDSPDTVRSLFADKEGDGFVIRRGYDRFVADKRVLIVEDILTTGSSVRGTVKAVRDVGGMVVGVAALCNRGRVTAEQLDVPQLHCLVEMNLETWASDECPLCAAHEPINTKVGHGAEYVAAHGQP
jgi:orotate phosphoribosyltransferase